MDRAMGTIPNGFIFVNKGFVTKIQLDLPQCAHYNVHTVTTREQQMHIKMARIIARHIFKEAGVQPLHTYTNKRADNKRAAKYVFFNGLQDPNNGLTDGMAEAICAKLNNLPHFKEQSVMVSHNKSKFSSYRYIVIDNVTC